MSVWLCVLARRNTLSDWRGDGAKENYLLFVIALSDDGGGRCVGWWAMYLAPSGIYENPFTCIISREMMYKCNNFLLQCFICDVRRGLGLDFR